MKYGYLNCRGHHLVVIEGKSFIIDTGSPISFSFDQNLILTTINDKLFNLPYNPVGLSQNDMENLIGVNIDGFIGLDIISDLGNVVIDKQDNKVCFDVEESLEDYLIQKIRVKSIMGMQVIEFMPWINEKQTSSILDTGATISYISENINDSNVINRTISDFNPITQSFESVSMFPMSIEMGSRVYQSEAAVMEGLMKLTLGMIGIDAVIGINDIKWDKLIIDIKKQYFGFI